MPELETLRELAGDEMPHGPGERLDRGAVSGHAGLAGEPHTLGTVIQAEVVVVIGIRRPGQQRYELRIAFLCLVDLIGVTLPGLLGDQGEAGVTGFHEGESVGGVGDAVRVHISVPFASGAPAPPTRDILAILEMLGTSLFGGECLGDIRGEGTNSRLARRRRLALLALRLELGEFFGPTGGGLELDLLDDHSPVEGGAGPQPALT